MPRAGAGGSGHSSGGHSSGGHSSGGHHSSSHSSGGHHVSSRPSSGGSFNRSSRPSGGGGFRSNPHPMGNPNPRRMGSGMNPPPPRQNHWHGGWHGDYHGSYRGGGCFSSLLGSIISFIVVIFIIVAAMGSCSARTAKGMFNQTAKSTVTREKLSTSTSFDSNCIVDELGWFDNVSSAAKSLKTFYTKTGVQPYVALLAYDSSLTEDSAKEDFANQYFDENIGNEDAFLFVYFGEKNQDEDVGYMVYVCGNNAESVMDSEAVDIFWDYIDEYWYSDLSTDDLFETVFTKTADSIMGSSSSSSKKSSTWKFVVIVFVILIAFWATRKYKKKEETPKTSSVPNDEAKDNPNILN